MGSYGYWEFYETFGGEPEPGEYVPDYREAADLERKRRREEGDEPEPQTDVAPS